MDIVIKSGTWDELQADASPIRFAVFVDEQRVPRDMELDDFDPESLHVVAYNSKGQAIATGRLLPDGHIGRMAVLPDTRGEKVGAKVLLSLIAQGRKLGHSEFVLSAQTHAVGFYVRFGFVAEGSEYLDAGIPHRQMRLKV
jgi:predicted GNAT family N-acyltransferase